MLKSSNKYLLLLLIFVFSFFYRMLLMHWQVFPPGADIGLHNSIIHSITLSGNTNFLWNYYQMGGGISLTFPGYHIFVSYIMLITGVPDYLAHSLIVSFFSSLIVLCAFLITRTVWGESASLIVAFLVAISRFDIEMLLWGGYPNVITLMLIPLTFYLFLQKPQFSLGPFLATTGILSGAIFLTHSLSAVMFVGITVATVVFVSIFSKRVGVPKTHLFIWLAPIFLGAIIVSPFLLEIAPAYFSVHVETFTGGVSAIRLALLSTKILPLEIILPLLASFIFFFLFSKRYKGNFFTVPAFLFALWLLIPTILTQGFLFGLYFDYHRFLYFVLLPVIMLIALAIDHGSRFFSRIIDTYLSLTREKSPTKNSGNKIISRLMPHITRKNLYSTFVLVFLLSSFLVVPIFVTPQQGAVVSSFYQVMSEPGYEAIQWIRQQTPVGSVLVSDAYYGWWLSGFAQRPTLSAVDPQYLTLTREFEPAKIAKSLLDTDYIIDNGLIQIREDGGYIGRHNPMFLAKLNWTYFPYPFLHFNNSLTTISSRIGSAVRDFDLIELPVKEMKLENVSGYATITVKKGNSFFNYTQLITVYKGERFVNMTITLESDVEDVYIDSIRFIVYSKGYRLHTPKESMVGFLDEGVKALGQIIFVKEQPRVYEFNRENPCILELKYILQDKSKGEIQLSVSVFSVTDDPEVYKNPETTANYMNKILAENLNASQGADFFKPSPDKENLSLDVFDYQKAIKDWSVSYIACRDSELIPKFAKDPAFSLVFINDKVAIFMVKSYFNQLGRQPSS